MAEKKGWIHLHRKIQDCIIWESNEPFDSRSAWIDLLLLANHDDKEMLFDGNPVTVKQGQRVTSIRNLADRWKWSKDKTLKFLRMLESQNMINRDSDKHRTLITIVNYGVYNDLQDTEQTQDGQETDKPRTNLGQTSDKVSPQTRMIKNEKNEKNDNNTSCGEPDKPPQPQEPVFIKLPLNDKTEFDVTEKMVADYKELYPAVNVEQELRNMRGWCLSNPQKRKTRRGTPAFISKWLQKKQDSGGYYKPQYPKSTDQQQRIDAMNELAKQLEAKGE